MSRIQISLPEAAIGQLRVIAKSTGEPASRVAARFVLSTFAGETRAQPPAAAPVPDTTSARPKPRPRRPPPWLQPIDEDDEQDWLYYMWAAIVALCRRYPTMLGRLPEHWWQDRRLVEWLSALTTWRINIDAASEDPREEIAFHTGLQQFSRIIDQIPGGERHFNLDTPTPVDWGG